ncbi:MAG: peptidyl-prolyl cis-trans isomerase [Acidobacteriota bacterium]
MCRTSRLRFWGALVLAVALLLAACGDRADMVSGGADTALGGEDSGPDGPVAVYDGGEVTRGEVDALVRALPESERSGQVDDLLEVYRQVAADRVVEEVLVRELGGDDVVRERLADEWPVLRRQVLLERWLVARAGEQERVEEEEIETLYRDNEDGFNPPPQRFLSMIYRRVAGDDPESREAALEALRAARGRIDRGEAFTAVASEVSQSETRAAGGRLGWIYAGRLDPQVEKLVFGLPISAISEPVTLRDGVAIFYVQGVREGQTASLSEARSTIAAVLAARKRRAWLEELSAGLEPPDGATVLELDEVVRRLENEPEAVVLEIADDPMTAQVLAERLTGVLEQEMDLAPALRRSSVEIVEDLYREDVAMRLLGLEAEADDLSPEAERVIEQEALRLGGLIEARRELDARMMGQVSDADLKRFYDDNTFLYTTPVEIRLRSLEVPLGPRPTARSLRLEEVARQVRAGETTLNAAADAFGGRVATSDWQTLDDLLALPPKVAFYVRELRGQGVTAPFRLDSRLLLVEVFERREPVLRPYEEVAEQVRGDYLERHRQRLYREVADATLERVGFTFRRAAALDLLTAAGPGAKPALEPMTEPG